MMNQLPNTSDNRFSICLLGTSLETRNRGVSALAAAGSKLLSDFFSPCQLTLLVPARAAAKSQALIGVNGPLNVEVVNYSRGPRNGLRNSAVFALSVAAAARVLPSGRIRRWIISSVPLLCSLERSDFAGDLFAGDSFSDIYGLFRLVFSAVPRWCALLLGKPLVLMPQTYGPFRSRVAKLIAASIIERATMVFSRTEDDEALRSLSLKDPLRAYYCPDVAFALDADNSFRHLASFESDDFGEAGAITVGVNVSGLLYNGGYTRRNMFELQLDYPRFIHELVAELLATDSVRVLLIPHTYSVDALDHVENDLGAIHAVVANVPHQESRLKVVSEELDQHQIKGVIGACDFFVGSRLHSCIAALSQGIVTVGVGYSKKFVETFSTVGMQNLVIDGRVMQHREAIRRVIDVMSNRHKFEADLNKGVEQNKQEISESFEMMRNVLSESTMASEKPKAYPLS